jgi:ABC-type dipeptide/oligopeptide/nickel transport system permease subunit
MTTVNAEPGRTVRVRRVRLAGLRRLARRFRRQRVPMVALAYLVVVLVAAVAAPVLTSSDPNATNLRNALKGPSGDHWLGTDDLGRDVFTRLLFAARISLQAAVQSVGLGLLLGVVPGVLAGYFRGWVDTVVMRITDVLLAFPPIILAIAIVGVLGPNLTNAMLAIGVIFTPRFVRITRSSVMQTREETYVEASRSIGTSTWGILRRRILPNSLSPLIVSVSLASGTAMIAEATLSFLGLGVQPPQASWGSMVGRAVRHIDRAPWLIVVPGLAIALTVLALNLVGDGLRDSFGRETVRS